MKKDDNTPDYLKVEYEEIFRKIKVIEANGKLAGFRSVNQKYIKDIKLADPAGLEFAVNIEIALQYAGRTLPKTIPNRTFYKKLIAFAYKNEFTEDNEVKSLYLYVITGMIIHFTDKSRIIFITNPKRQKTEVYIRSTGLSDYQLYLEQEKVARIRPDLVKTEPSHARHTTNFIRNSKLAELFLEGKSLTEIQAWIKEHHESSCPVCSDKNLNQHCKDYDRDVTMVSKAIQNYLEQISQSSEAKN
jgi:hypothetical protein